MGLINVDVSILIVTYNNQQTIEACLRSIEDSFSEISHEILIWDNSPNSATLSVLHSNWASNIRIIDSSENLGFAVSVNHLSIFATGKMLLLLNPDAFLSPETARILINALDRDASRGAVGAQVTSSHGASSAGGGYNPSIQRMAIECLALPDWGPAWLADSGIFLRHKWFRHSLEPKNVDWVAGTCLLTRRSIWNEFQGFSERWFLYGEDVDFGHKLKIRGLSCIIEPSAQVSHAGGHSVNLENRLFELQAISLLDNFHLTLSGEGRVKMQIFKWLFFLYYAERWIVFRKKSAYFKALMKVVILYKPDSN